MKRHNYHSSISLFSLICTHFECCHFGALLNFECGSHFQDSEESEKYCITLSSFGNAKMQTCRQTCKIIS